MNARKLSILYPKDEPIRLRVYIAMVKIALVRRDGLGDFICTLPLLKLIKERYLGASVTLFLDERNASLLPYLDRDSLPLIEECKILRAHGNKYAHLLTALRYRKRNFDLAVSAKTSPMRLMNLFLYCLGATQRVAYVDERAWDARFINCKVPYHKNKYKQNKHQALKAIQLLAPELETLPSALFPSLLLPAGIIAACPALALLKPPVLLLSASTTQAGNRLAATTYASVVNRLIENTSALSILLVSAKSDLVRAHAIQEALVQRATLFVPENFQQFMAACGCGDLFFVSDGGVAHIGGALGKSLLVLFGGVNPHVWHPLCEKCELLYHQDNVNCLSEEGIYQKLQEMWKSWK